MTAAEVARARGGAGESLFIDNDDQLDAALAGADRLTRKGFPVHGLLCHGCHWQRAVTRLLLEVDQVFLDLTGFHPDHRGTAFELQAALDLVDVGQLRLIAGAECDQLFLVAQLRAAWRAMLPGSPNARSGSRTLTLHVG